MQRTIIFLLLLPLSILIGQEKSTMFGLKGGLISSGTFYVGDFEDDTETSYSFGSFVDRQLGAKFYGGLFFDVHNIVYGDSDESQYNIGISLKAVLGGDDGEVTFRPGMQFGYAADDDFEYLTASVSLEVLFPTSGSQSFLGELTLYTAPTGGDSDIDVTFGPILLARGGIIF